MFMTFYSTICWASYVTSYELLVENEEPEISKYQSKFLDKTKDALLKIDHIEERADYFIFKLKNLTFGEYSDNVLYLAPLVTGDIQVQAYNFNVYYNHLQDKGGIKYKVSF